MFSLWGLNILKNDGIPLNLFYFPNEIKGKNKRFRVLIPLLVSQSIGAFNDNGIKAMLPIMAAYQFGKDKMDETNQIVSILLILPFVLFAPLAGWFSDRYAKKECS